MAWPDSSLVVEVGLALGADPSADPSTFSYTDVTAYTFDRDGDSSVVIRRGRPDESGQAQPGSCGLTVNNADGRFSPRNPTGAYYPDLKRNTPLRVRVNPGTGLSTRYVGFVSEWPSRWDVAEADFYIPIRADGVLRRLGQGNSPIKSFVKSVVQYFDISPGGASYGGSLGFGSYWPLEDAAGSTQAAPGLVTGTPLEVRGTVDFAAVTPPAGSAAAPDLSLVGSLHGRCTPFTVTGEWGVTFFVNCTGTCRPIKWSEGDRTWLVDITATDVTVTASPTGDIASFSAAYADGEWHRIDVTARDSGSDVLFTVIGDTGSDIDSGTVTGSTVGQPGSITINPNKDVDLVSLGHLMVGNDTGSSVTLATMNGSPGLKAANAFEDIATYNGIVVDVPPVAIANQTEAMGVFPVGTLLETMRQCADADEGQLVERLGGLLGFDSHLDRENLPVALTLDYSAGHISPPLEPTDDDQQIRNDVTVSRIGGSSGRFVDEDGPLGVAAVGRYDEAVELNLYTDDQAVQHASWRVTLGTVDLLRWPTVTVNLRANSSLVAAWLALDIGSRIQITNLPDIISYDDLDLIVEGYTEQISQKNWVITFNCAPYGPYQVGVLAEDDMTLLTAETSSSTTWRVASQPRFTTDSTDLPVSLTCGGEEVSVTAVSQVTTALTAGTASHGDNASLSPVNPVHAESELLILFAAIRNSGTGTVDAVSGWTSLYTFGNMRIFAKYAESAAVADPTVTFTGGAAGDTTSAVVVRVRGVVLEPVNSKEQLNGSAADIAFPCYVTQHEQDVFVLQFCWKQDDYTSVAPGVYLEVLEASSTTGNDQSLYVVRGGTAGDFTSTAAGSHTVTGGASAISRVVFLSFLRGVYDITVTRSVNGVVASHAQLADVSITNPAILAL